jgi:proteasome lid subunit RPN8/RPN11
VIRKITIPKDLFERMVNHSKEEEPIEACGFLIGDKVDDEAVASHIKLGLLPRKWEKMLLVYTTLTLMAG